MRTTSQMFHDHIECAAIEEVSHGQTPAALLDGQGIADLRSGFAKCAIMHIEENKLRFAIMDTKFRIVHLRVDMTIDENEVEPARVVEIDKRVSPSNVSFGRMCHASGA